MYTFISTHGIKVILYIVVYVITHCTCDNEIAKVITTLITFE